MGARLCVASLLLGTGLLGGCSSPSGDHATSTVDDVASSVAAGDPAYALTALHDTPIGDYGVLPRTLVEALPNHRLALQGRTQDHTVRFSRALVVGRVLEVVEAHATVWHDDESFTRTGFDDPRADTRTVLVTMSADRVTGAAPATSRTLTFRVLVPPDAEPQRFAEGLAGLDRIAVVLDRDPNRVDITPWRPIIDDRMILVVAEDGTVSLSTVPHGRSFAGHIHTVDDLLAVARGPVATSTVDAHRFLP
jgi:hypothetical protein